MAWQRRFEQLYDFFHCYGKIPVRKNLVEEGLILAPSSSWGKACGGGHAAAHGILSQEAERWTVVLSPLSLSYLFWTPAHGVVTPAFRAGPPVSANLIQKLQRCVSMTILSPGGLRTKINHHTKPFLCGKYCLYYRGTKPR